MTTPLTEHQYDIIHQSYNDIAQIREDGITSGYELDWETRDAFEHHMLETHDEELYEALEALEDEMKAFRANADNTYTPDELPTTPEAFFSYLEGKDAPDSNLTIETDDETLRKHTTTYSEDVTTLSDVVTIFEVPFGIAEDSEHLRTLMYQTEDRPEEYMMLLEAFDQSYEDLYQTITEEGIQEWILETSSWQLNYAEIEQQAETVEGLLDTRISQKGEQDE